MKIKEDDVWNKMIDYAVDFCALFAIVGAVFLFILFFKLLM